MTLPKSVFVVVGSTGGYSDHTEWDVAAYITREEADQHCDLANEVVKGKDWKNRATIENPYDPDMQMDYTGTTYYVEEIKLFVHVDEFLAQEPTTIS